MTEQQHMKILAVCPSIYPHKLEKMLNSFELTKSNNIDLICHSEGTVTEAINIIFNEHKDYDFYIVLNDDIEFITPLWDLQLARKGKITYGIDMIDGGGNGCFLMIDGDIPRAVGWLQLPTLNRYAGDTVWKFIGSQLDILEYFPDVIIKHHWEGASEIDNREDMKRFAEWLPWSFKDISRIREALNGSS